MWLNSLIKWDSDSHKAITCYWGLYYLRIQSQFLTLLLEQLISEPPLLKVWQLWADTQQHTRSQRSVLNSVSVHLHTDIDKQPQAHLGIDVELNLNSDREVIPILENARLLAVDCGAGWKYKGQAGFTSFNQITNVAAMCQPQERSEVLKIKGPCERLRTLSSEKLLSPWKLFRCKYL